jgi:hypothetical protein
MPWTVRVDPVQRISYVRASGVVRIDDVSAMQMALAAQPRFDPTFPFLCDLRDVEDLSLSWADIRQAILASPMDHSTRRAIVVRSIGTLGTARVYEVTREWMTGEHAARAFESFEEAVAWLGVERFQS